MITITLYFFAAIIAALAVGYVAGQADGYDDGYQECMVDTVAILLGKQDGLTDDEILERLERADG